MARWGSGLVDPHPAPTLHASSPLSPFLPSESRACYQTDGAIAAARYYMREEKGRVDGGTNTYTFGFVGLWNALTRLQSSFLLLFFNLAPQSRPFASQLGLLLGIYLLSCQSLALADRTSSIPFDSVSRRAVSKPFFGIINYSRLWLPPHFIYHLRETFVLLPNKRVP